MLEVLKECFEKTSSDPLNVRKGAWERFLKLGLPDKKQEAFQYVPLREFYTHSFAPALYTSLSQEEVMRHVLPECRKSFLLFVNGIYSPGLSSPPSSVHIQSLVQAKNIYGMFLDKRFAKVAEEKDPFTLLNFALGEQGMFAYLPPGIQLNVPVQCVHIVTDKASMVHPRLHLFLGKDAKLEVISTLHTREEAWINNVVDVHLEEGAQMKTLSFLQETHAWVFESMRTTLKSQSKFQGLSVTTGAKMHRQSMVFSLAGEGAEAHLQGIGLLKENHHAHTHILMRHEAPHAHSKQLFKGALLDHAQMSFEGKIFVQDVAQKTEAYQKSAYLLLGERAQAFSKPNLEIFADDVKASHGATFGQLDASALFYLKARGINDAEAKRLLVSAFAQEIGLGIDAPSLRACFAAMLERFI